MLGVDGRIALIDLMFWGRKDHELAAGDVGGGGVKCGASTRSASGNADDGDDTYGQTPKASAHKQKE